MKLLRSVALGTIGIITILLSGCGQIAPITATVTAIPTPTPIIITTTVVPTTGMPISTPILTSKSTPSNNIIPTISPTIKSASTGNANNGGLDTPGRIYPDNGATGVNPNCAFTWGVVTNASSYNFKLASDSAFANTIATLTGFTGTVYAPPNALQRGTTYYWEVQAITGTTAGNWVVNAFTTIK